jgi:putative DNA primase/helicase
MRPIRFQVSFAGKEDPGLFVKLQAEMGGILNWAIMGQVLLTADQGFLVPQSARGLVRSLQEAATPLHVFLYDCCTIDKDATVTKEDLFLVYQSWCLRTANRVSPYQTFNTGLPIAKPEIKEVRLRRPPSCGFLFHA